MHVLCHILVFCRLRNSPCAVCICMYNCVCFVIFQSVSPGIVETEFAMRSAGEEKAKEIYSSLPVSIYYFPVLKWFHFPGTLASYCIYSSRHLGVH